MLETICPGCGHDSRRCPDPLIQKGPEKRVPATVPTVAYQSLRERHVWLQNRTDQRDALIHRLLAAVETLDDEQLGRWVRRFRDQFKPVLPALDEFDEATRRK